MRPPFAARAVTVAGSLALAGCSSNDVGAGANSLGGHAGTAAINETGGVAGTAGVNTVGGVSGTAGLNAAGGASSGGAPVNGGVSNVGGVSGVGGEALGGRAEGGAGVAGRAGEGGSTLVAGAAGRSGGAGGGAGASGQPGGAGGKTSTAGQGGTAGNSGAGGGTRAGAGGTGGLGPQAPGGDVSGYGTVRIQANSRNQIVRLQTTLFVPPKPPPSGTLFLWPGLQPGGKNFEPIDNGVLQPVLTWGPTCTPGNQPRAYSTWWISGQYVNTNGNEPGYTDCNGGKIMSVNVGDELSIDMVLDGTEWTQTVTDQQTGDTVDYTIDMRGQAQNYAYFVIEEYSSKPVSEVIFTNTVITFGSSDAGDCKLAARGRTDYVSVPVASSDGLTCSISEIILRAEGID